MKARKLYALALLAFVFLAATALYAQYDAGHYATGITGTIIQPLPQTKPTDSNYDVGAFPLYRPVLEPGDGSREVYAYCNTCHSPMYITMQPPLPADAWAAEVAKMEKTYGADIPDEVTQKIVQYLQTHYTPETRKH